MKMISPGATKCLCVNNVSVQVISDSPGLIPRVTSRNVFRFQEGGKVITLSK
jgi:hypothetical protein